jgi:hypothetical protein
VKPGKTGGEVVKALAPGQKLGELEIQAVRDVVIGPGSAALAIVDALGAGDAAGTLVQHLVSVPKAAGAAPLILRKSGDKVPRPSRSHGSSRRARERAACSSPSPISRAATTSARA